MKRLVMIVLALLIAIPLFGRGARHTGKSVAKMPPKKLPVKDEPAYINTFGADHRFGPITHHSGNSGRDSEWFATLLDSSLNGYGLIIQLLILCHMLLMKVIWLFTDSFRV